MADIDSATLLVTLQSVSQRVNRYKEILKSETLWDPENFTKSLITYDDALKVLKSVYQQKIDAGDNLLLLSGLLTAGPTGR